ncbi:MAG: hypothetical protein AAGI53_06745 [Planctomycetota bacterium]
MIHTPTFTRRSIASRVALIAAASGLAACSTTTQTGDSDTNDASPAVERVVVSTSPAGNAVGETVGEGIYRFHENADARDGRLSSFTPVEPLEALGDAGASAITPVFSNDEEGRFVSTIAIKPGTSFYAKKGTRDEDPWAYGPEIEATARRALERRSRLMPLFDSLFEEAHRTGVPVARPLFFADPVTPALRDVDDAFMLGDILIFHSETKLDRTGQLVLPENDQWHEFDFQGFDGGRDSTDPDQPKLFVRESGTLPTGPVHEYFGDRPDQRDKLTLVVALNEDGYETGELYQDAGEGWAFRGGEFLRSRYTSRRVSDTVPIEIQTPGRALARPDRVLKARIIDSDGSEAVGIGRDGVILAIALGIPVASADQ